jgi:drug/metabolite transporter (DMT)-like permease
MKLNWSRCVQALLLSDAEKMSSMSLLAHMAPISAALLLPMTIAWEPGAARSAYQLVAGSATFTALLTANCLLAFFVNLTNFLVTKHCGALTLQVLGNAKGVVAAVLSVLIFQNPVSGLGWLGFGVTTLGVVAYSESRRRSAAKAGPASEALLAGDVTSPCSCSSRHGDLSQRGVR